MYMGYMNDKKSSLLSFFLMIAVLTGVPMMGCGSDKGGTAPDGSTIEIRPLDPSVTDKGPTATWSTEYFTITVRDVNNLPLNKVKLNIKFPWAVPDPANLVQLYDKDGLPVNSPYDSAYTDEFGVYNLRFDYMRGGGVSYFGNLEVRSGTAYASTKFTVAIE